MMIYTGLALRLYERDGVFDVSRHIVTIRDDDSQFGRPGQEAGQAPVAAVDGEVFNAQAVTPRQIMNLYLYSTGEFETVPAFSFERGGATFYLPSFRVAARDVGLVQYVLDQAGANELVFGVPYSQQGLYPARSGGTVRDDILAGNLAGNRIDAGRGHDFVSGLSGNDTLNGGDGFDHLVGDFGNDRVSGGGQNDRLFGNAGNDSLWGDAGADTLSGGTGNDRLHDGGGSDRLAGGGGADVFVLRRDGARDVITDFENGRDRIDLGLAFSQLTIRNGAAGTVEVVHQGDVLVIDAATALTRADITGADFL